MRLWILERVVTAAAVLFRGGVALAAAFASATPAAIAQTSSYEYRVIQLGTLEGEDTSAAFGLNEAGQVVGISDDSPLFTDPEAFIWLPSADFTPIMPQGISPMDSGSTAIASHGWDINDDGLATGWFDLPSGLARAGFVWQGSAVDSSLPVQTFTGIGYLDPPPNQYTEGRAIRELEDTGPLQPERIRIGGFSGYAINGAPSVCGYAAFEFRRLLGGPSQPLDLRAPSGLCGSAEGLGINPGRTTLDVFLTGRELACNGGGCFDQDPCSQEVNGRPVVWINGAVNLLDTTVFGVLGQGEARGANDHGEIVGLGRTPTSVRSCSPRAAWWASAASSAVDLHLALDPVGMTFASNEETEANGVNSAGTVVGSELMIRDAIRWRFDGVNWRYRDLDELIADGAVPNAACNWTWELRSSEDINEREWIVGSGTWDPDGSSGPTSPDLRAYLLVPCTPCDADLDGDGMVGNSDLGILLAAYGGDCCDERATGTDICFVDLNCDNIIGFDDQLIVLTEWGRECPDSLDQSHAQAVSQDLLVLWGALGGEALSASGAFSSDMIAECMARSDEFSRFAALCQLLEEHQ